MSYYESSIDRDANRVPIQSNAAFRASKSMVFAGGTTNDPGDVDGTGNPATLFTVTGTVVVTMLGICSVDLTGDTATVEVGIAGNTAALLAQTTGTTIDAGEVWVDATPGTIQPLPSEQILCAGTDIIQTVGTANVTAGAIKYYCLWRPLSDDGLVVAA